MSGLKVGRLQGALPIEVVDSVDFDGDGITLGGQLVEDDATTLAQRVQQIAGTVASTDELVVPVWWDAAHDYLEGYYRVRSGSAGIPRSADLTFADFSLVLDRVGGYAAPVFESTLLGGKRAGIVPAMTPQPFHALPATTRGYEIGTNLTPATATRQAESGPVSVFTTADNTSLLNARPSFFVPPADWYVGAATLRVDGGVVVGRQVRNRPASWQISNGLVRLTGQAVGMLLEGWSGAAWTLPRTVRPHRRIDAATIAFLDAPHTVTVLRNSPEEVAVRLTYDAASAVAGSRFGVYLDLSLRRGSRTVAMRLTTRGNYAWGFEMSGWGAGVGTALTGGSTLSGVVIGRDPNSGMAVNGTTARVQYVIGTTSLVACVGYGPGAGIDTPQAVLNQWAASQVERVEAVTR